GGKILYDTVYLRKADDKAVGDIPHVGFPVNRYKMVLTMREKGDVLFHQHLVVLILVLKKFYFRHVCRIQPTEDFVDIHLSHAFGSAFQAVKIGRASCRERV